LAAPSVPATRQHVVDHLLATIGEPGGALVDLPVGPGERARAAALLAERGVPSGSVLLAVGAGSIAKRWPIERFAALAAQAPRPVAALTGPAERDAVAALQRARPQLPVITDVDLALLPAVLAEAAAVVANDSGPGHLAAAVGTPVVALFGPTDPVVWAPRGARVEVLQADDGALGSISVDAVSAALARVLA
jgi:ADP-heptose:LPS heptosyltransferase